MVICQMPLPWEKAMGMVFHPGVWRIRPMSVRPLLLKYPVITRTPGWRAQPAMKHPATPLELF